MPELPEVEITRRQLLSWSGGRPADRMLIEDATSIRSGLVTRPEPADPARSEWLRAITMSGPATVERHGKRLAWCFPEGAVLIHLGMTGRLVHGTPDVPPRSARVGWQFGDRAIWFADTRRFGCVAPAPDGAALATGHGPDALDVRLTGDQLRDAGGGRRAIKVALLDQAVLAGLGNIHVAEILHQTGVDPRIPWNEVSDAAWTRLAVAIPRHLAAVVDSEDLEDFVYLTDGGPNRFAVYGREGEPCYTCGTVIERFVQGGRSTFWCRGCTGGSIG